MANVEWQHILQSVFVQRIAELICREFNLWVGFMPMDGRHVWIGSPQTIDKPLCEAFMIRQGSPSCATMYREWLRELEPDEPSSFFMECHAGMHGVIVPIVHDGAMIGAYFASGFVFSDCANADESIMARGKDLDLHHATLIHGCRELVRLTRRESRILRGLLQEMSKLTSELVEKEFDDARGGENACGEGENQSLDDRDFSMMIGESQVFCNVLEQAKKVCSTHLPILISGGEGTGKTCLAQAIRANSSRKMSPFVILHCGCTPPENLESELFGHKRGAFPNALNDKIGLIDVADRGTLLIENVELLPHHIQIKVAQFIEHSSFYPIGDSHAHCVDVRIIATTSVDLRQSVADGEFCRELFSRLSVVSLHLPSLSQHAEDIPLLCDYFMQTKCALLRRAPKHLQADALTALCRYSWPGNVRELENEIERIIVLSGNEREICESALALRIRQVRENCLKEGCDDSSLHQLHKNMEDAKENALNLSESEEQSERLRSDLPEVSPLEWISRYGTIGEILSQFERIVIAKALELNANNRSQTAQMLGISRRHLLRKLEQWKKR